MTANHRPGATQAVVAPDVRVIDFGAAEVTAIRTSSLGNWSYLIASDGEAVAIDPQRDAERYLHLAEKKRWRLRHVLETHIHSDYLSGGLWLAGHGGATVVASGRAGYEFGHERIDDGHELEIAGMKLRAIATPGHSFDHVSWQLLDRDSGAALAVLSGGSLLRSGAGRTDLAGEEATDELTRAQWESIRKISSLDAGALLFPTHDGGSTCSVGVISVDGMPWWDMQLAPEGFPTVGEARQANAYLDLADAAAFAEAFLDDHGPAPAYFGQVARINRQGPPQVSEPIPVAPIPAAEFAQLAGSGAWVIDARNRWNFADSHIPDSLSIEPNDAFAVHVGALVPFGAPLAVVLETGDEHIVEALAMDCFRVGYSVVAFLEGGIDAWSEARYVLDSYPSTDMLEVVQEAAHGASPVIVDVREPSEWRGGVISGSTTIPVSALPGSTDPLRALSLTLDEDERVTVACYGGARASVAASYLARLGIPVRAILGGGIPDGLGISARNAAALSVR